MLRGSRGGFGDAVCPWVGLGDEVGDIFFYVEASTYFVCVSIVL